jgi:hypothetical protein
MGDNPFGQIASVAAHTDEASRTPATPWATGSGTVAGIAGRQYGVVRWPGGASIALAAMHLSIIPQMLF